MGTLLGSQVESMPQDVRRGARRFELRPNDLIAMQAIVAKNLSAMTKDAVRMMR